MTMAENLEGRESAKDNCLGTKEVNRHLFQKFLITFAKISKNRKFIPFPISGYGNGLRLLPLIYVRNKSVPALYQVYHLLSSFYAIIKFTVGATCWDHQ
jgi:hypothetical protein